MDTYEVLMIENNNTYYIRYYPQGMECKGIDLKLDEYEFDNFIEGKVEV